MARTALRDGGITNHDTDPEQEAEKFIDEERNCRYLYGFVRGYGYYC